MHANLRATGALLAALLLCSLALAQQSAAPGTQSPTASLLAQGRAFAQQGDYLRARQAYTQQLQQGPVTVPLLYNLGNACFQQQQLGWAILYYERAMLAAPRDRDLRANLAAALANRRVPPPTEAPGWMQVVWSGVLDRLTLNELALLAALCYLVTCGLSVWWLRAPSFRRRFRFVLAASVLLLVLFGSLAISKERTYYSPARAVMVADSELMSGPAESFQSLRKTYQGEMVQVQSQQGMWREVRFEAGATGWVPQSDVETIVPSGH